MLGLGELRGKFWGDGYAVLALVIRMMDEGSTA